MKILTVCLTIALLAQLVGRAESNCAGMCPSGNDACFKRWSANLTVTSSDLVGSVWQTSYISSGQFFFDWNLKRTLFNSSRTLPDNNGDDPTWAHIIAANEVSPFGIPLTCYNANDTRPIRARCT